MFGTNASIEFSVLKKLLLPDSVEILDFKESPYLSPNFSDPILTVLLIAYVELDIFCAVNYGDIILCIIVGAGLRCDQEASVMSVLR